MIMTAQVFLWCTTDDTLSDAILLFEIDSRSAEVVYDNFKIDSYDLWVHHLVCLTFLSQINTDVFVVATAFLPLRSE